MKFAGKNLLFEINTLALMFVPIAVAIPRYLVIVKLDMLDTYFAHILPVAAMPVGLFLLKQFIDQVPNEVIEAAIVDGANDFQVFYRIVVPIIRPALATVAILAFQAVWNNTESSSIYINNESMKTLSFFMNTLVSATGNSVAGQGLAAAASLIMFIPNLVIFIVLQGKVMNTMAHSGLK